MKPIILASGSPRRQELLTQIGLEFIVIPSKKEEVLRYSDPKDVVEDLSRQKAEDIAARAEPGTVIIGADTVVALDGEILGKPHDPEEAKRMLNKLQGRTHQVFTGVTIVIKGEDGAAEEEITFSEKTEVHIYSMADEEIRRYVATGDPLDKAGAYGIQGMFAAYVEGITGSFYNVMGLPVGRVYQELKRRIDL